LRKAGAASAIWGTNAEPARFGVRHRPDHRDRRRLQASS